MQLIHVLVGAAAIPLAQAASNKIIWSGPCNLGNKNVPTVCGTLKVPLDYTNPNSNQTLDLEIAKLPATGEPKGKSVLMNPGGPGIPGLNSLPSSGPYVLKTLRNQHDVVTFNPRGTGNTLPFFCGNDSLNYFSPNSGNSSDVALGQIWANGAALSDNCLINNRQTGELIGTAFVARDMMQIVDALGEDGLLNYWGFSYGSALGAVAAGMFPNRMGKVILDGVVNAHEYFHGFDTHAPRDADKALSNFCSSCLEAPSVCPLAKSYKSPGELEGAIYSELEALKYNPIYYLTILTYDMLKEYFRNALGTQNWLPLSQLLNSLITKDMPALENAIPKVITSVNKRNGSHALWGIKCSDKTTRASNLTQIRPYLSSSWSVSRLLGDVSDGFEAACAQWEMSAKEHYNGDFHAKTSQPILLIGNTNDPITPLSAAHNMSAGFEGSVVLQQNSSAHTSTGQISSCTGKFVYAYFANGSLPAKGTVCQPDSSNPFFPKN